MFSLIFILIHCIAIKFIEFGNFDPLVLKAASLSLGWLFGTFCLDYLVFFEGWFLNRKKEQVAV